MIDWTKPIEWVCNDGKVFPVIGVTTDNGGTYPVAIEVEYGTLHATASGELASDVGIIRNVSAAVPVELRDRFAMAAITGLSGGPFAHAENIARQAYAIADAMIAERSK